MSGVTEVEHKHESTLEVIDRELSVLRAWQQVLDNWIVHGVRPII